MTGAGDRAEKAGVPTTDQEFLPARARIARARAAVDRMSAELAGWLQRRRAADALQQYRTQLGFLEAQLGEGLKRLLDDLGNLAAGGAELGRVYRGCREVEIRLAWLGRVWGYFRRKFDQRDEGGGDRARAVRETLLAADEVVWSCYAPAFESRKCAVPAAPLPYFEALFTPNAQPRTRRPPELDGDVDQPFLKLCLQSLPIPVLGLPWVCVDEPWWLVLLAHEVGHHVQHDLEPASGAVRRFAELLAEKAGDEWFARGEEVFADAYSVLCCGTSAIRALVEFVLDDVNAFHASVRAQYPSPRVRLAIMTELARQLGLSVSGSVPEYVRQPEEKDLPPAVVRDLGVVGAVADAVRAWTAEGGGTLETLTGFRSADFETSGVVEGGMRFLLRKEDPPMGERLASARHAVSAGMRGWSLCEARWRGDPGVAEGVLGVLGDLAVRLPRVIRKARVEGTRAGVTRVGPAGSLAAALSQAPMEELS